MLGRRLIYADGSGNGEGATSVLAFRGARAIAIFAALLGLILAASPARAASGRLLAGRDVPASELEPFVEQEPFNGLVYVPGGRGVQHSPHIYLIFWGSNWNTAPGPEAREAVLKLYEGLPNSAYQGLLTQYFDSTGRISQSVSMTAYTDTSVSAPTKTKEPEVEAEVTSAINANGWTREFNAQFFVLPAPGSTVGGGCGYHEFSKDGFETSYAFAYPFGGCDLQNNFTRTATYIVSHEYAETATNPLPGYGKSNWYADGVPNHEIGDLCQGAAVEIPGGVWVTNLWDDHQNQCSHADLEPPHVYALTKSATAVTSTEATLNGVINPEGLETKYHFEYGTAKTYGSSTPEVAAGAGTENVAPSPRLTKLIAGKTYNFRAVATNSTGTNDGRNFTFTTPPPSWSAQQPPSPAGTENAVLKGLSCLAEAACTAIGNAYNGGSKVHDGLAESWNGTTWSPQELPAPAGAKESALNAVSCAATKTLQACFAVGHYESIIERAFPLGEMWNGATWSIVELPNPAAASNSFLTGVSCTTTTVCSAIGYWSDSLGHSVPLAERLKGKLWSLQEPPAPPTATASFMEGVSCVSTICEAVGYFENAAGQWAPLAESWNGTSWSAQEPPAPSGAKASYLTGVSCAGVKACTATGYFQSASGTWVPLAEIWNGSTWSAQGPPAPSGAKASYLTGVSCAAPKACTATGYFQSSSETSLPLAENWNGKAWTAQEPPAPVGALGSRLAGVECTLATSCIAVGEFSNAEGSDPLAEIYH